MIYHYDFHISKYQKSDDTPCWCETSKLAIYHLVGENINLYAFFRGIIWNYLSKRLMHVGLKIAGLEIDPIVMLTPITNTVYIRIFTETTKCLAKELLRKWNTMWIV